MKKILYSPCFGGFGLSIGACILLHKLGLLSYEKSEEPCEVRPGTRDNDSLPYRYDCVHIDEITHVTEDFYIEGDDAFIKVEDQYYMIYFNDREIERDNQQIIEALEKYGLKEASGDYARLTVCEWPDELPFVINEYDGNESVCIDTSAILNKVETLLATGDISEAHRLLQLSKPYQ